MKMRNKGKVYPSLPSSSSSTMPPSADALSALKFLPAAILALASVLSVEDREVLAYMITTSMKSANLSSIIEEKKNKKKSNAHKPPVFDCGCFDCYTSYWFRWDSSPNRELINQAIEAFEEYLANGEQSKKNKGKKREKMGRRITEKPGNMSEMPAPEREIDVAEVEDSFSIISLDKSEETAESGYEVEEGREEYPLEQEAVQPTSAVVLRNSVVTNHRGLARKVLPDVLGLLNSRLWGLWSPHA